MTFHVYSPAYSDVRSRLGSSRIGDLQDGKTLKENLLED